MPDASEKRTNVKGAHKVHCAQKPVVQDRDMSRSPTTFVDIFSHWNFAGGYVLLAKDMRVPQSRARMWLKRGYLEPYYWPDLIRALQRRFTVAITLDDLIAASAARAEARIKASRRSAQTRAVAKAESADADPARTEAA